MEGSEEKEGQVVACELGTTATFYTCLERRMKEIGKAIKEYTFIEKATQIETDASLH